jgi:AcrR family transcriptional regulator
VTRTEASERLREAIVAATVRIVARDGVGAVTHRRVAEEAGVSLSSTTWHFASKAEILEAALAWTARREVARVRQMAERLAGPFDPVAWSHALAAWVIEQTEDPAREVTVALYRLQLETLGRPGAIGIHREWSESLGAIGVEVLAPVGTADPELDTRLVVAALDGLRLAVLSLREQGDAPDVGWVRPAIERLLRTLVA